MKRTVAEIKKFNAIYRNVQAKNPKLSQKAAFMRTKAICDKAVAVANA